MIAARLVASGAPEGPFLFIPPVYEIVLSAVCLGVIALIMVKVAVPAFLRTLDQRTEQIEGGLRRAEEAEAEAAAERARWAGQLEEAKAQAGRDREAARADAAAIVAEARGRAEAEAKRIMEAAAKQIASQKQAAEVALRADVGALATELAERIVGEALTDRALTSRVIDRFLDQLEAEPAAGGGRP
ncbi:MAG: F0F1 ATP synthase subunit B [Bifidobacteriaceae bacterium]|nr:F0F1 ATP synthase subunit B [Bifidobacteriaceae bacterium]